MNRIFRFMTMACVCITSLSLFTACQKDDPTVDLNAVVADHPSSGAKVYINGLYGCWQNDDEVRLRSGSKVEKTYSLSVTSNDANTAKITGVIEGAPYTAGYPAANVSDVGDGRLTMTIPSTQHYESATTPGGTAQRIVSPMAAYSADGALLKFYNVGALLKVDITNGYSETLTFYAVEVESDNAPLAGTANVTVTADSAGISGGVSNDSKTVALTFSGATVSVAAEATATLYIPVLPIAESAKSKLTVHVKATGDNGKYTFHGVSSSNEGVWIGKNQMGTIPIILNESNKTSVNPYFWGQGTADCPFIIATYGDLDTLRHLVNHSSDYNYVNNTIYKNIIHNDERYNSPTVYYRQVADIDLDSAGIFLGTGTQKSNWGYYTSANGERDYNPIGYSPTLYFKANYDGGGHYIKNIYYYTGEISEKEPGSKGIFGYAGDGSIKNLKVTGTYKNTKDWSFGGIVGESVGISLTIDNCTSEVIISSTAKITNSNGLGGIIGKVSSPCTITNCSFLSTVSSTNNDCTAYLGGIVGLNTQDGTAIRYCSCGDTSSISSNYKGSFGGICGITTAAITIDHCTNNSTITNKHSGSQTISCGGILGNIDAANKTIDISNCTNNGTVSMSNSGTSASYVGGIVGRSTSVSQLNISYCTNDAKVSGYKYAGGILAYINTSGTYNIKNCSNAKAVTGADGVGGIVGYTNSYPITLNSCSNTGTVTGTTYVGGLIGIAGKATLNSCSNTGTVTGANYTGGLIGRSGVTTMNQCRNSAEITSSGHSVGGLVGRIDSGSFNKCLNEGDVSANGNSEKWVNVGGLLGYGGNVSIINCGNTGNVSGTSLYGVAGIIGDVRGDEPNVCNSYCKCTVGSTNSAAKPAGMFYSYQSKFGTKDTPMSNCYFYDSISNAASASMIQQYSSAYDNYLRYCYDAKAEKTSTYASDGKTSSTSTFAQYKFTSNGQYTGNSTNEYYTSNSTLIDALNSWVDAQSVGEYLGWVDPGDGIPVLDFSW